MDRPGKRLRPSDRRAKGFVARLAGAALWVASLAACEGVPVCVPGDTCPLPPSHLPLAVGGFHACWIHADGTLWCWGDNGKGELGFQNDPGESQPTLVNHISTWSLVATGSDHTCAIRKDGSLWCWGENYYGETDELNPGQTSALPQQVEVKSTWSDVACGAGFTCGVESAGTLRCWGDDEQKQITGLTGMIVGTKWSAVSAGDFHACALDRGGGLWCWGDDERGQLGDASRSAAGEPPGAMRQVEPTKQWTAVTAGRSHSCGLQSDETLWCWGDNTHGQLGLEMPGVLLPVRVPEPDGWVRWTGVSAGGDSTCATADDGTLWCWGENAEGKLGLGTTADALRPMQVGTATNWREAVVGEQSTCAARDDGSVACWGFDGDGQVGDGDPQAKTALLPLLPDTRWSAISSGYAATCGVQTDGTLWCTGYPSRTPPATPYTSVVSSTPVFEQVGTSTGWTDVSVGETHACAAASDGSLWCWGDNTQGQLGWSFIFDSGIPRPVASASDWRLSGGVAAGIEFTCALKQDGTLWCWGSNAAGTLGVSDAVKSQLTPMQVGGATWLQLCAGDSHACAIRADGTLWCWGFGGTASNFSPVQSGTDSDWAQVACGSSTVLAALKTDGTLWTGSDVGATPTPFAPGAFRSVTAAEDQVCAVSLDGHGWCAGGDDDGDLGNGNTKVETSLVPVGPASDWATIVGGFVSCSFGLKQDGALWGWGSNEGAQLGLPGDVKSTPFVLPGK